MCMMFSVAIAKNRSLYKNFYAIENLDQLLDWLLFGYNF